MKKYIKVFFLYGTIAYVLAACFWWSYLLMKKNTEVFDAKVENLESQLQYSRQAKFESDKIEDKDEYKELVAEYERQKVMIWGEGAFFLISLVVSIYLMNIGYRKEGMLARQQSNFLLSITHELKSPIASIRLVLETFLKRDLSKEHINRFSGNGLKEVERLNNLVNNILLAARIETSHELKFDEVDIEEILRGMLSQLREKYPTFDFDYRLEGDIPKITADKMGISILSINLLENAIKYAGDQKFVGVTLSRQEDNVLLEVADLGEGIPDKEKKKIFDKFYRIGNENTRKSKGTGLGLYIVNEIAKAHKGQIQIKNNMPRGVIFQVAFPIF